MMNENIKNEHNCTDDQSLSIEKVITIVLSIFLFVVPLAYSPAGSEFDGIFDDFYYEPKLKTGLILIAVAGILFIIRVAIENIRMKLTSVHVFILLFLAAIGLATLLSPHPEKAFWGRKFRSEGFLAFLMYGSAFILFSQVSLDEKRVRKFIHVIVVAALVASIYGVLQFAGFEFLPRDHIRKDWWRAFATSGNPDFLSAFLLLVLPFPVFFFLGKREESNKRSKIFWLCAYFIILSCILATYHRGAWMGLLIFVAAGGMIVWKKHEFRKLLDKKRLVVLLLVFLVSVFSINALAKIRKNPTLFDRISHGTATVEVQESSIDVRTYIWRATIRLIIKRPVYGWGPDTMFDVFQRNAPEPAELGYEGAIRSKPDKPENLFLQVAYEGGMLALVPFVIFICLVLIKTWSSIEKFTQENLILLSIFTGIIAYLAQQQFSFSTLSTTPMVFSLLGLGSVLSYKNKSNKY